MSEVSRDPAVQEPVSPDDRDSGLTLSFSISISYNRQRGRLHDRWESRVDSVGLMIIGGIVVIVLLVIILPRFFEILGKL